MVFDARCVQLIEVVDAELYVRLACFEDVVDHDSRLCATATAVLLRPRRRATRLNCSIATERPKSRALSVG